jgi:hypothetical protein
MCYVDYLKIWLFKFCANLPEVQLSTFSKLFEILNGYMDRTVLGNLMSNRNFEKWGMETDKECTQVAGFTLFCWYIICVSHGI